MSDPSTTPGSSAPGPSTPGHPAPGQRAAGPGTPDPRLAYEPPVHGPAPTLPPPPPQFGGYGPPPPPLQPSPQSVPGTVSTEDRNWAMAAHLSGFVAAYLALGFLGPLVVMLTVGNRSPFVRRHAVEALNFNLTVLIAAVVSAVLVLVLVGVLMLVLLGILYVAATIAGAIAASRGQDFRYPLTIRFVS